MGDYPFPEKMRSRYTPTGSPLSGGMGVVFPCQDRFLGAKVALKIFTGRAPSASARNKLITKFNHEVTVLQGISHPNVVQVFEHAYINIDNLMTPYYTMEWLEGASLLDIFRKHLNLVDFAVAAYIMNGIMSGLHAIHRQKILHCDLKPHNVMLTSKGVVKLIDFGIARNIHASNRKHVENKFSGTPAYASPEHFQPELMEPRSDIFCAGWILYSLLTHQPPPTSGKGPAVAMGMLISGEFQLTPLRTIERLKRSAAFLQPALDRFLAPDPKDRWPDAHIAGRELNKILQLLAKREGTNNIERFLQTVQRRDSMPPNLMQIISGPKEETQPLPMRWSYMPRCVGKLGNPSGRPNEQPLREVELSRFAISSCAITAHQYLAFILDAKPDPAYYQIGELSILRRQGKEISCAPGCENHPITCVNFQGALAYCRWLSKQIGAKVSLPTEAQWEAAASWDLEKRVKWHYPWSMEPESHRAHVQRRWMSPAQTLAPVDAYPDGRSPIGCFQMLGNVWEWCLDGYYDQLPAELAWKNPVAGSNKENTRAIRGGDFNCSILALRTSLRAMAPEWARLKYLGFRVVVNSNE